MTSDAERREVARRLREFADDYGSGGVRAMNRADANDRLFKAIGFDYLDRANWVFLGDELPDLTPAYAKRLADLIEPSCDRNELLELADEIECDADRLDKHPYSSISPSGFRCYAESIREALGVES